MAEPAQVLIRRLPAGESHRAELVRLEGAGLDLELAAETEDFIAGVLAEAQSGSLLYLGQVQAVNGRSVTLYVEHLLNLDQVAAFRRRWQ